MRSLTRIALAGAMLSLAMTVPVSAEASRQTTCRLPHFGPGASYHPTIHPADFSPKITNRWFPLPVGTTYIYSGSKDGKQAVDVVQVSRKTKLIDDVTTRVINDRLFLRGVLEERTSDYYAQDRCGNVWYFGEDTATLDRQGHVTDRSGSFRAGVNGAEPGVYMQARPQVGRWFRQEWSRGQAEDRYKTLTRSASITVRYGTFDKALKTLERTRLEPGVIDNKYYARGIGVIEEITVKGGNETMRLVAVLR